MTETLAIIANANANRSSVQARQLAALRAELRAGERLYITHSQADLEAAAAAIRRAECRRVALVGGDGSLTMGLSALRAASPAGCLPPELVLLRGGTMNTVARALGVPRGQPAELLRRARTSESGQGRRIRPLLVNGQVGFLLSTGLMFRFLDEYYARGPKPSALDAAQLLAAGIASATRRGPLARRLAARFRAHLEVDTEHSTERLAPAEYLFIGAGAVPEVGLGFRPYARVSRVDHAFQLLGYRGSVAALSLRLPAFAVGRGECVARAYDRLAQRALIRPDEPLPFALDGELHPPSPELTIESGPALRIVGAG